MLQVEFDPQDISSPKRSRFGDRRAIADWYGYYAGYSVPFVKDIISTLQPPRDGLIVDPWNGAGTTTATSSLLGYRSFGSDINPAMLIISRARSALGIDATALLQNVSKGLASAKGSTPVTLPWFSSEACHFIGRIKSLVTPNEVVQAQTLSDTDCIMFTALFATLKLEIAHLRGTNPNWWKITYDTTCSPPQAHLDSAYMKSLQELLTAIDAAPTNEGIEPVEPSFAIASSKNIPLSNEEASLIITSPPYLTRLDYVKAMLIELQLLGFNETETERLRREMTGSVMGGAFEYCVLEWGDEAKSVLEHAITAAQQKNRKDGNYYAGTFSRYFRDLFASLVEMNRILISGGSVAVVVQGSRHRGRIIDLPLVIQQMAASLGWEPLRAVAWPTRDLGRINPRSSKYGNYPLNETAVLLRKP
ncbi:hypothetical protein MCEMSE15_00766 [Fimbriimonadaceae bacterium]